MKIFSIVLQQETIGLEELFGALSSAVSLSMHVTVTTLSGPMEGQPVRQSNAVPESNVPHEIAVSKMLQRTGRGKNW